MITILVAVAIAGIAYAVYKNLPEEEAVYDDAAKEENLVVTDVEKVV